MALIYGDEVECLALAIDCVLGDRYKVGGVYSVIGFEGDFDKFAVITSDEGGFGCLLLLNEECDGVYEHKPMIGDHSIFKKVNQ